MKRVLIPWLASGCVATGDIDQDTRRGGPGDVSDPTELRPRAPTELAGVANWGDRFSAGVECFPDAGTTAGLRPDYDQFGPTYASHCNGTDHQEILDVERVVFLGDSITVGTPPTTTPNMYRNILADELATRLGLTPPELEWQKVDVVDGVAKIEHSGDFWSCAEWGARTDDLVGDQIDACFPVDQRDLRTLVVMTVGGNDLAVLQQEFAAGDPLDALWNQTEEFVERLREATEYLTDPAAFPGGTYVIMANPYEYTDGTGVVTSCPAADLSGLDDTEQPELVEMVTWTLEEYVSIAVDTQTDVMFMQEAFCGHGYMRDDPTSPCYRGPDADLWFDLTCTHPNPTGHQQIANMFGQIVLE